MNQRFENEISLFIKSYIACALWSSTDDGGVPFDSKYEKEDIEDDSLFLIVIDCYNFYRENHTHWEDKVGYDSSSAGHDFWLTRNGHGAGFWDREELSDWTGELLTDRAKAFGEVNLYVGDNGNIFYS